MTRSAAELIASGDIDALLAFHRSQFGAARMDGSGDSGDGSGGSGGSGDGGQGGSGSGDGGTGGAGSSGGVTFTADQQAEVNRITGQRTAEATRAAIRQVAQDLGMTVDEAKQFIAEKKAADEAAKSEEQKRLDAIAAKERDAEAKDAAAAAKVRDADIRIALAEAGATGQELRDAAVLIGAGLAADADEAAITTAVDDLKKRRGELFKGPAVPGSAGTNTDTGSGSGAGSGSGGGNGSEGKGGSDKLKAGEENARKFGLVTQKSA